VLTATCIESPPSPVVSADAFIRCCTMLCHVKRTTLHISDKLNSALPVSRRTDNISKQARRPLNEAATTGIYMLRPSISPTASTCKLLPKDATAVSSVLQQSRKDAHTNIGHRIQPYGCVIVCKRQIATRSTRGGSTIALSMR